MHLKYDLLCAVQNYHVGELSPIGKKYATN